MLIVYYLTSRQYSQNAMYDVKMIISYIYLFSRYMWTVFNKKPKNYTCLIGKTALVTGGNSGIGFYTALGLACRGCRVIIADVNDSKQSVKKIIELTNNPNIVAIHLNLASFKSIRNFAKYINENESRLDILINNAGIGSVISTTTEDGYHPILQINHLGSFLLTHLLVELLKNSAPSRIIFVSSVLAYTATIDEVQILKTKITSSLKVCANIYADSKIFNCISSNLFAEILKKYKITSNCLHPGYTNTNLVDTTMSVFFKSNWFLKLNKIYMNLMTKTPAEGAENSLHLALSKELENVTGEFFIELQPFAQPPLAIDRNRNIRLWKSFEKIVGLKEHEKIFIDEEIL